MYNDEQGIVAPVDGHWLKILAAVFAVCAAATTGLIYYSPSDDADRIARASFFLVLTTPGEENPLMKKYSWESLGKMEKAQEELLKVSNTAGLDKSLRMKLGLAYYHSHAYDLAERELQSVRVETPDDPAALFALGDIYKEKKDTKRAMKYLHRSWLLDRGNDKALEKMGDIAFQEKRYMRTYFFYKQAERLTPRSETILLKLANTYVAMGDEARAVEKATEILKINPENKSAYFLLLYLYEGEGSRFERFEVLKQLYQRDPNAQAAFVQIGEIYRANGYYREAIRHYKKYLAQFAKNPWAYYFLGRVYMDMGYTRLAIEQFHYALLYTTNEAQIRYYLGMAHLSLGQIDQAYWELRIARIMGQKVSLNLIQDLEKRLRVYPQTNK